MTQFVVGKLDVEPLSADINHVISVAGSVEAELEETRKALFGAQRTADSRSKEVQHQKLNLLQRCQFHQYHCNLTITTASCRSLTSWPRTIRPKLK